MTLIRSLLLLIFPALSLAHPGGGLIALNEKTVIFGDPTNNALWRMEKGERPTALFKNFHVHWTTLGLDGNIYSESFQEIGGALFRIDLSGKGHSKVAEETELNAAAFAVGRRGELIFQKGGAIVERSSDGTITNFRGNGTVSKGDPKLEQVIAYHWSGNTLYFSDGAALRRVGEDGVVRIVARLAGKMLDQQIWNSTGSPRVWSVATDAIGRIYAALPDIGQVIRIDPDGKQNIIDSYSAPWRVTAVAVFGDSVFFLESNDRIDTGQRVRVMRGSNPAEIFGVVE